MRTGHARGQSSRLLLAEWLPHSQQVHVASAFEASSGAWSLVVRNWALSESRTSMWDGLVGRGGCSCYCQEIEHPS